MEHLHLQPEYFFAAKRSVEMRWRRVLARMLAGSWYGNSTGKRDPVHRQGMQ
jgi:hypothetical protein